MIAVNAPPSPDLRERQRVAAAAGDARRVAREREQAIRFSGLTPEQYAAQEAANAAFDAAHRTPVGENIDIARRAGRYTDPIDSETARRQALQESRQSAATGQSAIGASGLSAGQIAPVTQQASGGSFSTAGNSQPTTLPPQAASNIGAAAPAPSATPFSRRPRQRDPAYFGLNQYG